MLLVRYSEIGLKGHYARSRMENLLVRNISMSLESSAIAHSISKEQGRIYIETSENEKAIERVRHIFGVKSVSVVEMHTFDGIDDLRKLAVEKFSQKVSGKRFAVRARRTGTHPFTSLELERIVGEDLLPFANSVSLADPEITVYLEVREKRLYIFSDIVGGPGGLPLGSEGKMTALVSGGIDSPVAAWTMMKRGCRVDLVFVALADPLDTETFLTQAGKLISGYSWGYDPRIWIVNGSDLVEELTSGKFRYPNVSFKRILYLIAEKIARREESLGLITGESLGQVSSQTPENLRTLSLNLSLPVYRPLIGMDKDEIVRISREWDLMPGSSLGEFCSLFADSASLNVTPEQLEAEPINDGLIESLISGGEEIRGSEIKQYLESRNMQDLTIPDKLSGAVVIDMRSREKFEKWHYPGAVSVRLKDLDQFAKGLDREKQVVLYCSKGLQSAHAAARLRKEGFNAFYTDEETIRDSKRFQ